MKRIHIVGGKNQGKTTLVVDLVEYFCANGLRVATIKHSHHEHELDTPGKDSYLHRQAGAAAVGIVAGNMNAVFWPTDRNQRDSDSKYDHFEPLMNASDLILVEGDQHGRGPKVEVWRAEVGREPLANADPSILAVVSDDLPTVDVPVLSRSDMRTLGDFLLSKLKLEGSPA